MTLNKIDGTVTIDDLRIEQTITVSEAEAFGAVMVIENNGYKTYKLNNGENSLTFFFYKGHLERLSFILDENYDFPPFIISGEEKIILIKELDSIGGERIYSWGSVELSEDRKGGIISIVITYKYGQITIVDANDVIQTSI